MVELALATADATEIETQRREAALHEHVEQLVDDLVIHGAAEAGMRVQDDRDRRALFLARLIPAFEATRGAVEDDFGHTLYPIRPGAQGNARLDEEHAAF